MGGGCPRSSERRHGGLDLGSRPGPTERPGSRRHHVISAPGPARTAFGILSTTHSKMPRCLEEPAITQCAYSQPPRVINHGVKKSVPRRHVDSPAERG